MFRCAQRGLVQAIACLVVLIPLIGPARADLLSITGQALGGASVSLTDSAGDPLGEAAAQVLDGLHKVRQKYVAA